MNRNDTAVLMAAARNAEKGAAHAAGSRAAAVRLASAGLIVEHGDWSGCYALTDAGRDALDRHLALEAAEARWSK